MNVITRFCVAIFLLFAILLSICTFRTFVYFNKPTDVQQCSTANGHRAIRRSDQLLRRFANALSIKTVTRGEHNYDSEPLIALRAFLEKSFPRIHSSPLITREIVSNYSLLYAIKGSDASLKPYMLCSHLDVVPVEMDKWHTDPFGGHIKDGYFYGRGTIDVKNTLMASLESLEFLLENGFKPKRSFYMAFGHDEEGSGVEGASQIATVMKAKHADLEYILDEGSMIVNGSFKGVDELVAVVSVTEKGYVTVRLDAEGQPGHSSLPPKETAIVILSKALSKFTSGAFPAHFGRGIEKDVFELLAPYAKFPYKFAFSNLWLFGPLISFTMSTDTIGNSMIRTSTAVTIVNGGFKPNVLPSNAYAIINHRIHPADKIEEVLEFDRRLINDDRVKLSTLEARFEAHPTSPYDQHSFGFQAIKRSIRETFPDTVVIPGMMLASTDTKYYLNLTRNIYRFSPSIIKPEEFKQFHGHNERLSVDNYMQIVNFYHHLILVSDDKLLKTLKPQKDEL